MNWEDGRPVEEPTEVQQKAAFEIAKATLLSGLTEAVRSVHMSALSPATRELGFTKYLVHCIVSLMKKREVPKKMIRELLEEWIDEELAS